MKPPATLRREIALIDLLDRLLATGVVVTGDITLAVANVDLVHISLRALITSLVGTDRSTGSARIVAIAPPTSGGPRENFPRGGPAVDQSPTVRSELHLYRGL